MLLAWLQSWTSESNFTIVCGPCDRWLKKLTNLVFWVPNAVISDILEVWHPRQQSDWNAAMLRAEVMPLDKPDGPEVKEAEQNRSRRREKGGRGECDHCPGRQTLPLLLVGLETWHLRWLARWPGFTGSFLRLPGRNNNANQLILPSVRHEQTCLF